MGRVLHHSLTKDIKLTDYHMTDDIIVSVVKATEEDAHLLAPKLRDEDLVEVIAQGHQPLEALLNAFNPDVTKNSEVWSIVEIEDGKENVIGMFGSCDAPYDYLPNYGIAWMLSSPELEEYNKSFLRYCRKWVDTLQERYEVLYNLIHCQNSQGMRWLQWCGFEVKTQRKFGVGEEDFYLFTREK